MSSKVEFTIPAVTRRRLRQLVKWGFKFEVQKTTFTVTRPNDQKQNYRSLGKAIDTEFPNELLRRFDEGMLSPTAAGYTKAASQKKKTKWKSSLIPSSSTTGTDSSVEESAEATTTSVSSFLAPPTRKKRKF